MLLQFSVRNYCSLATEQQISMIASRLDDGDEGLIAVDGFSQKVLPVAVIYGANAAGKSNVLTALDFVVNGLKQSHKNVEYKRINRQPFLLGDCAEAKTSTFEIDFLCDHPLTKARGEMTRFTYGFSVSDEAVMEEWLYAYPNGHRQVWFHRNQSEKSEYYFGRELKGYNKTISELTRPSVLFLSSAFVNNHQQLSPIYTYLTEGLLVRLDNLSFDESSPVLAFLENDSLRNELLGFLKNADTGICEAQVEEVDVPQKTAEMLEAIDAVLRQHFPNAKVGKNSSNFQKQKKRVRLGHRGADGTVFFNLKNESRGTLAFLELLGMVLMAIASGAILVVDEFDSSLHPLLSKQIIGLFNSPKSNPKGAQLVFSTHDASLLSREILRRDQIYFVEKDQQGRSSLYPLTKLKTKKGDNIQKGYLEGRFGAIPFLGDFEALIGNNNGAKVSKK